MNIAEIVYQNYAVLKNAVGIAGNNTLSNSPA